MKFKKDNNIKTLNIGKRKVPVIILWVLLICSIIFAIFNNINSTTKIINNNSVVTVDKVKDTAGVMQFARNFIKAYYSWEASKDSVAARDNTVNKYLTPELQELNKGLVRDDVPVRSVVADIQIWSVEDITDYEAEASGTDYELIYSVVQSIFQQDQQDNITSCYSMQIHQDADKNLVIIKNPTICSIPGISSYYPDSLISDGSVDANTRDSITDFLKSFFKLYPTASSSELSYYLRDNCLPEVKHDYVFSEIIKSEMIKEDAAVHVIVSVKYLDNKTKMTQLCQYDLILAKDNDNWIITESRR